MTEIVLICIAVVMGIGAVMVLRNPRLKRYKAILAERERAANEDFDTRFFGLRKEKLGPVLEALDNLRDSLPVEHASLLEWDDRGDKIILYVVKQDGVGPARSEPAFAPSAPNSNGAGAEDAEGRENPEGPDGSGGSGESGGYGYSKPSWPALILSWRPTQPSGWYTLEWSDGSVTSEQELTAFLVLVSRVVKERLS